MSVYVNATSRATKLSVGLYTDANGHPGMLLTQGSKSSPTAGATNDIPVSGATVTSGTQYWIAIMGTGGQLTFRDQVGGGKSETYAIPNQTTLPASWQTGITYNDGQLSAYGSASGGQPVPPVLNVTPTSLSFTATTGGADPASKTAALTNTGGGSLSFTTSPGASAWLTATPAAGSAPATITVSPHISGLSAGTYDGTITVTAAGATGSPQTIAVHLTVTDPPPPPPPALGLTPTSLSFTATTGGADPASKTAAVTNTGSGSLTFTTSTGTADWLAATPASGSAPATVTVSPHISGLAAGGYDGTVTVTAAGATGSPKTVAVHLTVTDPAPPPPPSSADWLQVDHDAERTGFASGETTLGAGRGRARSARPGPPRSTARSPRSRCTSAASRPAARRRDVIIAATSGARSTRWTRRPAPSSGGANFGTPPSQLRDPRRLRHRRPAGDRQGPRPHLRRQRGRRAAHAGDRATAPTRRRRVAIITGPATNRVWGGPTLDRLVHAVRRRPPATAATRRHGAGAIVKVDISGATPSLTKQWDVVPGIPAPNGGGGIWGYGGVSVDPATGRVYTATGADSMRRTRSTPTGSSHSTAS